MYKKLIELNLFKNYTVTYVNKKCFVWIRSSVYSILTFNFIKLKQIKDIVSKHITKSKKFLNFVVIFKHS